MSRQTVIIEETIPKIEPLSVPPNPQVVRNGHLPVKIENGINQDVLRLAELASEIAKRSDLGDTVKVSTSLSFLVYLYEQVRNVVDNKSDHLLRRNAIERIFRRLIWENPKITYEELGSQMVKELVWSRYLSNNFLTADQTNKIVSIITKYSTVISRSSLFQSKPNNQKFALSVLSAEIEEAIDPRLAVAEGLSQTMEKWFEDRYIWLDENLTLEQKQLLLFIVVRKVLVKSDNARIAHQLVKKEFPNWGSADAQKVKESLKTINDSFNAVSKAPNFSLFNPLYRLMTKHTAQFVILKDVLDTNPVDAPEIIQDKEKLTSEVTKSASLRYQQIKGSITTGIIRSVFYILASKVLFVLLLEIPYELLTAGHINFVTLLVNLAIPPLLMLTVGLGIPRPDSKNTSILVDRVKELVFPRVQEPRPLRLNASKAKESWIFNSIYAAFVILVFTIIVTLLSFLHFNFVGILVFFLFLSLVLLFGFRVGFAATELYVEVPKKGILSRLFEQISLPFLNLGVILSKGLDRLNFLTVVMDLLFEMPLKTIIDIVNKWGEFVGKKRAEMVEVPIQ